MPLTLLLGSLAGIVLLVVLNRLLSERQAKPYLTLGQAEARLKTDFPDFEPGEALLSDDGNIALLESSDGSEYAILLMHGRDLVSRRYARANLHLAGQPGADASPLIQLKTKDFSLPRLRINIADDGLRAAWCDRFSSAPDPSGQKVKHGSA